jgi:hypothetical protein
MGESPWLSHFRHWATTGRQRSHNCIPCRGNDVSFLQSVQIESAGALSLGVKGLGSEYAYLTATTAVAKDGWSCTSVPHMRLWCGSL